MSKIFWQFDTLTNKTTLPYQSDTRIPTGIFRNARKMVTLSCEDGFSELPTDFCRHATALISADLPSTVTKIGAFAFADCSSLESLQLPKKVRSIPEGCFLNDFSLTEVSFSETLEMIEEQAFSGCRELKSIHLPSSLKFLGRDAFNGCCSLTDLHLPAEINKDAVLALPHEGNLAIITVDTDHPHLKAHSGYLLTDDGHTLCYAPPALVHDTLVLPEDIHSISDNAFRGCHQLKHIVLPHSLRHMGRGAFAECPRLQSVVFQSLPNFSRASRAEEGQFYACHALTEVSLPNFLTHLPAYFFAHSGLTRTVLPKSVLYIEEGAFYGCALHEVTLPPSLKKIDCGAFYGAHCIHVPEDLEASPHAISQHLNPNDPPCNCTFTLANGDTLPVYHVDESPLWQKVFTQIRLNNLDWQLLDEQSIHLSKVQHLIEWSLLRLHHYDSLPNTVAKRYQENLQMHADRAAKIIIQQDFEQALARLLKWVEFDATALHQLIQLAYRQSAHGCLRLLSQQRVSGPRQFQL